MEERLFGCRTKCHPAARLWHDMPPAIRNSSDPRDPGQAQWPSTFRKLRFTFPIDYKFHYPELSAMFEACLQWEGPNSDLWSWQQRIIVISQCKGTKGVKHLTFFHPKSACRTVYKFYLSTVCSCGEVFGMPRSKWKV